MGAVNEQHTPPPATHHKDGKNIFIFPICKYDRFTKQLTEASFKYFKDNNINCEFFGWRLDGGNPEFMAQLEQIEAYLQTFDTILIHPLLCDEFSELATQMTIGKSVVLLENETILLRKKSPANRFNESDIENNNLAVAYIYQDFKEPTNEGWRLTSEPTQVWRNPILNNDNQ